MLDTVIFNGGVFAAGSQGCVSAHSNYAISVFQYHPCFELQSDLYVCDPLPQMQCNVQQMFNCIDFVTVLSESCISECECKPGSYYHLDVDVKCVFFLYVILTGSNKM